jgi:hypothetical protein
MTLKLSREATSQYTLRQVSFLPVLSQLGSWVLLPGATVSCPHLDPPDTADRIGVFPSRSQCLKGWSAPAGIPWRGQTVVVVSRHRVPGYYYYDYYYYYLTAIGLTPGGSSNIYLRTNSTRNTEDGTHITITRKKITITRK